MFGNPFAFQSMLEAAAPPAPPVLSPRAVPDQEKTATHPPSSASGAVILPAAKKRQAGVRSFDRSKDILLPQTGSGPVSSFASASAPAEYIKPASIEALEARAAKKHKKQGEEKVDAEDIDSEVEVLSDEDDGLPPLLSEQELAFSREVNITTILEKQAQQLQTQVFSASARREQLEASSWDQVRVRIKAAVASNPPKDEDHVKLTSDPATRLSAAIYTQTQGGRIPDIRRISWNKASYKAYAATYKRYCELMLDVDLCPLPEHFSCYSLNLISYAFAICKDFRGSRPQYLSYLKSFSSAVTPWSMEIKGVYSSAFRTLMSIAPQPHGEEGFRLSHIWQLVFANKEHGKTSLGTFPTAVGTLDMTYELLLRLLISAWFGVMRTESFTTVARQTHPNGKEVRYTHSVGKRQQYGNRPRQVDFCCCCDYAPQVEGARVQICPVCCIRDSTYGLLPKINTQQTSRMIRKMLDLVGIENKKIGRRWMYNSYSTRRGGAQSACDGGMSVEKLRLLGGWLSDETVYRYRAQAAVTPDAYAIEWPLKESHAFRKKD